MSKEIQKAIDIYYLQKSIETLEKLKSNGELYNGKKPELKIRSIKRAINQIKKKQHDKRSINKSQ